MIDCPECGAQHYPGTLFCDMCGAAIHPAARAHVAATARPKAQPGPAAGAGAVPVAPKAGGATPPAAGLPRALRAYIPDCRREVTLRAAMIHVGRIDPDTGLAPELDLTACGGLERGVSRRHATLQWVDGGYALIDHHSANGTWLEGTRLVPGYAYPLPPQAAVRFGDLLVQLAQAD